MNSFYALLYDGSDFVRLSNLTGEQLQAARDEAEKLVEEIDEARAGRQAAANDHEPDQE